MQPLSSGERQAHSSLPEDRFVELFAEVFGLDKVQLLAPQFPVEDIMNVPNVINLIPTPFCQLLWNHSQVRAPCQVPS